MGYSRIYGHCKALKIIYKTFKIRYCTHLGNSLLIVQCNCFINITVIQTYHPLIKHWKLEQVWELFTLCFLPLFMV